MDPPLDDPRWPLEIVRLRNATTLAGPGPASDAARGALWRLLFEALLRYLRIHSRGRPGVQRADLEDVAADKALEILARAESGAWDPNGRSAAEISGYVSSAARFGWIDFVRRAARETRVSDASELEPRADAGPSAAEPMDRAETLELVQAMRECVGVLPARERRVWFLRAYYDLSTREIAAHPEVRLQAPHVDVVMQRSRRALARCLLAKGHSIASPPRGAFVDLWELLESMARSDGAAQPMAREQPEGRKR